MISRVDEVPETKDIEVTYIGEDGKPVKEVFDLLVLSTGLKPRRGSQGIGRPGRHRVGRLRFCENRSLPTAGDQPAGRVRLRASCKAPKDIPESVAQASGAAACATRHLGSARNTQIEQLQLPPELDTSDSNQRIGVWVCNCGINIGGVVNVPPRWPNTPVGTAT